MIIVMVTDLIEMGKVRDVTRLCGDVIGCCVVPVTSPSSVYTLW